MSVTLVASVLLGLPGRVLIAQAVLMGAGALFVLTRPSGPG
jgi:hypothetical protein